MGKVVAQQGAGRAPGAQAGPWWPTAQTQRDLDLPHSLGTDRKGWCGNSRLGWGRSSKNTARYSLPSTPSFTRESSSARPLDYFLQSGQHLCVIFILTTLLPGGQGTL